MRNHLLKSIFISLILVWGVSNTQALNPNFTKGEVLFIYTDNGDAAWTSGACVKLWFNNNGTDKGVANTQWLSDYDDNHKLFYAIVPGDGANKVQLQRFASNCSTWWNACGDALQSSRQNDAYNTFYSTGAGNSDFGWKNETFEMYLYGAPNNWASSLGTFAHQGNGVYKYTYRYKTTATSLEFKLKDSKSKWHGNNVSATGLTVGKTYDLTGTVNLANGMTLTMAKSVVSFPVTFASKGTFGSSKVTAKINSTTLASGTNYESGQKIVFTASPASGYEIVGWYSDAACTTSLNNEKNTTYTINSLDAPVQVYVKFEAQTYTITYKDQDNADFSGTHTIDYPTTHTYGTATTLKTASKAGYTFDGWHTDAACTNKVTSLGATTYTANITLYAKWILNATYSLEVQAGEGIASVAGSTDPVTLGNTYEIKATSKMGYTFSTWTANPAANATFGKATTAETTVTVNNGSVTVTASATEILAQLTTANSFDAGTPSLTVPTTTATKIGVATTATITATEAPSGYTFVGWTLTNCERTNGGADNATEITVKSTGTDAAAQVTANYEINKYYIIGSFNGWSKSDTNYEMTYDNGVYKKEVTFEKGAEFKINDGADAWWGYDNLHGVEYKELEKSNDTDKNIKLTKDATFTIIFDLSKHFITFEGLNEKYTYVLMGVNKDWTTGIVMERNPNNTHERMLTCQPIEKANDAIKVAILEEGKDAVYCEAVADNSVSHTRGEHNNIVLEDGVYDFYYKIDENKLYIGSSTCTPSFEISATAENGTVTGTGIYNYKETATLKANPAEGYHFEKWSNGSTDNPLNIVVTEDAELQAIFAINTYTVTATATEGGAVIGDGTYNHGETVTLTATAADGYTFTGWSNGETANPYTFEVTKDVNLTANFELKSYTITATATNGTVTGAGTYNHGATVTLTATPNFDYKFVKWSNESTENPLTITATGNVELTAIFAEVQGTTVAESGVFTVGEYQTAIFATGNLQYKKDGENETWRFAKQQYQVVGEQNINVGDPAFEGWIDMFGWSNGDANNFGVNPSNKNEDYDGEFVDWGTKMGEGWLTLSADQWKYLLNERTNASSLKQIAKVGEILGIMLFPDNWTHPADCSVTPTTNHDPEDGEDTSYDFDSYNYTLTQWTKLEEAGAIFLPAAGRRAGGYGNTINKDQVEETHSANLNGGHYKHQDNTNIYCYYWTSTINESTKDVSFLHNIQALGGDKYTIGTGAIWGEKGRYGQSVRLAKVTSTLIEIGDGDNSAVIEANAGQKVNVQINRIFTANTGYYTLCLPFDIAAEKIGTAYQLGEITEHVSGEKGGININLTEVDKIEAGVPYLVLPNTLTNPVFEKVIIENTTGSNYTVTGAGVKVTFTGIINGKGEKTDGETEYYVGDNGYLYNGKVNKLGLRAFFTITDDADKPISGLCARVVAQEDEATGVEDITAPEGQVLKVIENGQLIIIRGGEKYNVQGVRL